MDIISLALALSQFLPSIVKYVTGNDSAASNAQKIVNAAKSVTGKDGLDCIDALKTSPDLLVKFQEGLLSQQLELAKVDAGNQAQVNETIRTELANSPAEAWYQKAWRPFCGFIVGLGSFVGVIFVCYLMKAAIESTNPQVNMATVINAIPELAMALAMILSVPGAAVGITAWTRGKAQIEAIRNQ